MHVKAISHRPSINKLEINLNNTISHHFLLLPLLLLLARWGPWVRYLISLNLVLV